MDDEGLTTLRALAHPARLQILSLLTGAAMSAAEVAREIGTTQANASYHLRRLHEAGKVQLVEEVPVRGGMARRFRYVHPTAEELATRAPEEDDRVAAAGWFTAMAEELRRRSLARRPGGGLDSDAELWLDPEDWHELVSRVREVAVDLHARARPPRTPGTIRTSTTLAMFTMDPTARPRDPADES